MDHRSTSPEGTAVELMSPLSPPLSYRSRRRCRWAESDETSVVSTRSWGVSSARTTGLTCLSSALSSARCNSKRTIFDPISCSRNWCGYADLILAPADRSTWSSHLWASEARRNPMFLKSKVEHSCYVIVYYATRVGSLCILPRIKFTARAKQGLRAR